MNSISYSKNQAKIFPVIGLIILYVILLCVTQSNTYWYFFLYAACLLQLRFKLGVGLLIPLIATLTLTEYYFTISDKRVYFCEPLFYLLVCNYFLIKRRITNIFFQIIIIGCIIAFFQLLNLAFFSDFTTVFFRMRTLAFPLAIIGIVVDAVKTKSDLQVLINIILTVSFIAAFIVFIQYLTGKFYILQTENFLNSDERFFLAGYLDSTADSFFFNLLGLNIKGPIPPVGLNYYKFGFSEKIIMPTCFMFSMAFFSTKLIQKLLYWVLGFTLFVATLLTGSRSVLIVLLVSLLLLYLFYRKKIRWVLVEIIIIVFFVLIYFIFPFLTLINSEELGTLVSRISYLDEFYKYIANNPLVLITGSNADDFLKTSTVGQPPHHFFAFGILFDGIVVTLILFIALFRILKRIKFFYSDDKEFLAIIYGLWTGVFGFVFIYGQTSYLTWSIPHNLFFCFMIGLLICSYKIGNTYNSYSKIKGHIKT